MKKEILLSQSGLEKLKNELIGLKSRRKEVAERIRAARDFGDLSENSEYEDARNEQSFVEGRIQELSEMIKNARVVNKNTGAGTIEMGSVVMLELDKENFSYELVGANESDPLSGKISVESPLGYALTGKAKGDKVDITTPSGTITYKIIAVK